MDTDTAIKIAREVVDSRKRSMRTTPFNSVLVYLTEEDRDLPSHIAAQEVLSEAGYAKVVGPSVEQMMRPWSQKLDERDLGESLRAHVGHVRGDDGNDMPDDVGPQEQAIHAFMSNEEAFMDAHGPVNIFKNPKTKTIMFDSRTCVLEFTQKEHPHELTIIIHSTNGSPSSQFIVSPAWKVKVV